MAHYMACGPSNLNKKSTDYIMRIIGEIFIMDLTILWLVPVAYFVHILEETPLQVQYMLLFHCIFTTTF